MRILTVVILTVVQFTAIPFVGMLASNAAKHQAFERQASGEHVTTIYKSASM